MKMKEESEKVGLKLNIQETKIMASSLITSWYVDGETVEKELFIPVERQKHYFADKGLSSQGYGFSSIYVWM